MKNIITTKKEQHPSSGLVPFGEDNFPELFSRFLNDPWFRMPSLFHQSFFNKNTGGSWWPKADVSETDKEIKIKINLPGVDIKNIKLEANANGLVVTGFTEKEDEEKGEQWYRAEREVGEFRRLFELPSGCDIENIHAMSKNGALQIVIPKKEEAQKKKIDIKVIE